MLVDRCEVNDGFWHPSDLVFIKSVSFDVDVETGEASSSISGFWQPRTAKISGWPSFSGAFYSIELDLFGVSNFNVGSVGPGLKQILGFVINDRRCDDLEAIKYDVMDDESDDFKISCKSFDIRGLGGKKFFLNDGGSLPVFLDVD